MIYETTCRSSPSKYVSVAKSTESNVHNGSTLVKIQIDIKTLLSKQAFERFWLFTKDPETINDMRKELNDAVGLFQVRA
jgi:hypothetical protein